MTSHKLCSAAFLLLFAVFAANAVSAQQSDTRTAAELFREVENYQAARRTELTSQGKRIDSSRMEDIANEKKSLARKYAAAIAARPDVTGDDHYYLGRLYLVAENEPKVVESMSKYIALQPAGVGGDLVQSARIYITIFSAKAKQMAAAEQAYVEWLNDQPRVETQRPVLQDYLSVGYFKSGEYESAIRHGQSAFDLLKSMEAKTIREKRDKEQIYMNLVEVLAMSYRKNKKSDQALAILAEARVQSFAIPSANLYRKVMDFVEGSGFSEKKLMQKVESYTSADPAPEMKIIEWMGQESLSMNQLRGKVVLLDFWATWCMPCIATFPRLRSWHQKYSVQDFTIIGVTQFYGQQGGKKMSQLQEIEYLQEFKRKHKLPYDFAIAPAGEAASKYGVNAFPTTVLLDRNGVVRYIGIGAGLEESENLEDMIEKVLKEDTRLAKTHGQ